MPVELKFCWTLTLSIYLLSFWLQSLIPNLILVRLVKVSKHNLLKWWRLTLHSLFVSRFAASVWKRFGNVNALTILHLNEAQMHQIVTRRVRENNVRFSSSEIAMPCWETWPAAMKFKDCWSKSVLGGQHWRKSDIKLVTLWKTLPFLKSYTPKDLVELPDYYALRICEFGGKECITILSCAWGRPINLFIWLNLLSQNGDFL